MIKSEIHSYCLAHVDNQLDALLKSLRETQEAANNESKSSAGDKHETARAMAQLEIDRMAKQIEQVQLQKSSLQKLSTEHKHLKVGLGSYIESESHNFYVSVGLGEIRNAHCRFYAIAPEAPLAQQLLNKVEGDQFLMAGKRLSILKLE